MKEIIVWYKDGHKKVTYINGLYEVVGCFFRIFGFEKILVNDKEEVNPKLDSHYLPSHKIDMIEVKE